MGESDHSSQDWKVPADSCESMTRDSQCHRYKHFAEPHLIRGMVAVGSQRHPRGATIVIRISACMTSDSCDHAPATVSGIPKLERMSQRIRTTSSLQPRHSNCDCLALLRAAGASIGWPLKGGRFGTPILSNSKVDLHVTRNHSLPRERRIDQWGELD